MLKGGFGSLCLGFFLAVSPLVSTAFVVTIEPDDYLLGTDLSKISPYVTLQQADDGFLRGLPFGEAFIGPVQASLPGSVNNSVSAAPTGNLTFGTFGYGFVEGAGDIGLDGRKGLGLRFEVPITHVSFLANSIYNVGGNGLPVYWLAFDADGHEIADGNVGGGLPTGQNFLIDIQVANMASLVLGGFDGSNTANLDRLVLEVDDRYAKVPEPGSLILLATGLGGVMLRRRKNSTAL
jgi:hypothetical protein